MVDVNTPAIRLSEMEAARDFEAVLERVRAGATVVIEHDATPIAVVQPASPVHRTIADCVALLPQHWPATIDADFARDVAAAVASHTEQPTPPASD